MITRRNFLQLGSAALLKLAYQYPDSDDDSPPATQKPNGLGRVTRPLKYYEQPAFKSKELGVYNVDSLLNIYEQAQGDARTAHNRLWFRTDDGWAHSAYIQPVQNRLNKPVLTIPETNLLVEVTVPFTEALTSLGGVKAYRFYYTTTHWVDQVIEDKQSQTWYRVLDDRLRRRYWGLAQHFRPVTAAELRPLSPEVTDKRIEVDLTQQKLEAYENGRLVLSALIASGHTSWETPTGRFRVERKRPSRHMAAGDPAAGVGFDLPGIPWVSYFHWSGVAFHGTYWHNDYGTPKSAGCVNMKPEDAKWLYRWTLPVVPPESDLVSDPNGTAVVVVGKTPDD